MANQPRLSPLMRDLAAIDALGVVLQTGTPVIPVVRRVDTPASGAESGPAIVGDPVEADASDQFRYSSPNRVRRSGDDGTMRHRRLRRR